jgi:hypothetical protein
MSIFPSGLSELAIIHIWNYGTYEERIAFLDNMKEHEVVHLYRPNLIAQNFSSERFSKPSANLAVHKHKMFITTTKYEFNHVTIVRLPDRRPGN